MKIPEILRQIAEKITEAGGRPFLVGGAVRDHLTGRESKDLDVEVFGISLQTLASTLKEFGYVRLVGKAFGVLKLFAGEENFDFSLPRTDVKTGAGHKGFQIKTDPRMSFRQAASRRDFTVNAMGIDILSGRIMDEFGGREDLKNKILRVVDPRTFVDDPLRVLRGVQFAARFEFEVVPDSLRLFRRLAPALKELPKERIFEELKKLLLKSKNPSVGFQLADRVGAMGKLFPDLRKLRKSREEVWSHTLRTIDEAAKLRDGDQFNDICLMTAAVCRNLDKESLKPTRRFLKSLTSETKLTDTVLSLVRERGQPVLLYKNRQKIKDGAIRRLYLRVNVSLLLKLSQANYLARLNADKSRGSPAGAWLENRLRTLGLNDNPKILPLLMGRHLIELGLKPGSQLGRILKEAFELQLDGQISDRDQALKWAEQRIKKARPLAGTLRAP